MSLYNMFGDPASEDITHPYCNDERDDENKFKDKLATADKGEKNKKNDDNEDSSDEHDNDDHNNDDDDNDNGNGNDDERAKKVNKSECDKNDEKDDENKSKVLQSTVADEKIPPTRNGNQVIQVEKALTTRERQKALLNEWASARTRIFNVLSMELTKCFPCRWVKTTEILDGAFKDFKWAPLFKNARPFSEERGTLAYLADGGRHVILRRRFGYNFYLRGFQHGAVCDRTIRETISMQITLAHESEQIPSVDTTASAVPLAYVRNALFPTLRDAAKAIVKIQAKGSHQVEQEASSSSSIIVLADCLCFVKMRKKTHPDQTKNWWPCWPAILYKSTKEFQSHNVLDTSTKAALSTKIVQQHLANARSGKEPKHASSQIYYVATLLGRPLKDLLVLRPDDLFQNYHLFLPQILPFAVCKPNVFESTNDYLNFHKGLDQAAAILMEPSVTTNTNDIGFYTLAQKAIKKQDDPKEDPKEEPAQAPNTPVLGDHSVVAFSISNESWISADKQQHRHHHHVAAGDASRVATALLSPLPSSPLPSDNASSMNGVIPTCPPSPLRIPTLAPWEAVWIELQFQGWTCQKYYAGQVLYRQTFQDPGMTLPRLQSYISHHHGWTGPC